MENERQINATVPSWPTATVITAKYGKSEQINCVCSKRVKTIFLETKIKYRIRYAAPVLSQMSLVGEVKLQNLRHGTRCNGAAATSRWQLVLDLVGSGIEAILPHQRKQAYAHIFQVFLTRLNLLFISNEVAQNFFVCGSEV